MKKRSLVAIVLALVVLGAAACGGDEEPNVDDILNDAEQALEEGLEEAEEQAEDALDAAGGFDAAQCLELSTALAEAAGAAVGTSTDPEAAVESLRNMAEVADGELGDDLALMADAMGDFFAALADAGIDITDPATYTSEEAVAALTEANEALESSGMQEASENINTAITDLCGG